MYKPVSNKDNLVGSHFIQLSNINMLRNCESRCHLKYRRVYYKCREDSETIHKPKSTNKLPYTTQLAEHPSSKGEEIIITLFCENIHKY
jgi:hypothetical protein